mgnify:FL=1
MVTTTTIATTTRKMGRAGPWPGYGIYRDPLDTAISTPTVAASSASVTPERPITAVSQAAAIAKRTFDAARYKHAMHQLGLHIEKAMAAGKKDGDAYRDERHTERRADALQRLDPVPFMRILLEPLRVSGPRVRNKPWQTEELGDGTVRQPGQTRTRRTFLCQQGRETCAATQGTCAPAPGDPWPPSPCSQARTRAWPSCWTAPPDGARSHRPTPRC